MRILITEEALATYEGHWFNYIGDLVAGFRTIGDDVTVLTHKQASPEICERVNGTPWYTRNCWKDRRSQGKIGGLLHNWHFFRETREYVNLTSPFDRILALTMRMQHLLAFMRLTRSARIPSTTRFVLLFVQGFGRFDGPGSPTRFKSNISNYLARMAFASMSQDIRSGRVVIAGETASMCNELSRFTGLPTKLFPHPVRFLSEISRYTDRCARSKKGCITIACPGFARYEKGIDLLQDAVILTQASPRAEDYHFVFQWNEPFKMPSGELCCPDRRLIMDPRVEFLRDTLSPAQYVDLLRRSDFIILPYRASSYHNRLSRVAIEASGMGVPLLYTANTWAQELSELVGCGVRIDTETPQSLAAAMGEAFDNQVQLKARAVESAQEIRSFHSVEMFRTLLES
jgi:glycosyltransferase involved in cell wall biosynthesis